MASRKRARHSAVVEPPHILQLRVKNYRALKDVEFKELSKLAVFLGPNGSGKSTLFDVFAFLSECFTVGLRAAWEKRGRFRELRSRGADGSITIEIKYQEPRFSPIRYHLRIEEDDVGPVVASEWMRWRYVGPNRMGASWKFLDFRRGRGTVVAGDKPEQAGKRVRESLDSAETLAVGTLGQLTDYPRVRALRRFITGWYLSHLTADGTRAFSEGAPQERLSQSGDNLPNVIEFLRKRHPRVLDDVIQKLSERIPRLETVEAKRLADRRLLLQIKDAPFAQPFSSNSVSDGTLKMLAYLLVLNDPNPPPLVGIEEPEAYLYPRLLLPLAEEWREATARSQLLVTTHSPFFVNGIRPEELWVLYRGADGYTRAVQASSIPKVEAFMREGAQLGQLWMEGHFGVGDPLVAQGEPAARTSRGRRAR